MRTTSPTVSQPPVKVSVVVPTHNTGKTVLTGLRSFLTQTMPRSDFEVVYVDDGSSDDTVAILEDELARRGAESTVRIIRIANSGWPGRPRNVGMDAARGEFVHFVDDDDWLAPEALERTYARARETGADIVIGRMAGHGRRAPRALFEKPLTAADLRTDNALLTSMTVHKLFRRSFLQDHGLRFAEGPVRLEDHMFTLRAYLLTDRVATVHDYTCYHWVRHSGDAHNNISYGTIDPGPYIDSVRKVLAILDAPDTRVGSPSRRHRLGANWYGKKALARLSGERYLAQSEERRTQWFEAVGALAAELPPEADAALPTRLRIVAALARHHDRAPLDEYAKFEAGVDHRPHVRTAKWDDGRLTVDCVTRLVRKRGKGTGSAPLVFSRVRDRYRLRLAPYAPAVAAVPQAVEAADFTGAIRRSNVRVLLRHREGGTVLSVPLDHRVTEEPLGAGTNATTAPKAPTGEADAAKTTGAAGAAGSVPGLFRLRLGLPWWPAGWGRAARAARTARTSRSASRVPGARPDMDECALRFETEFTIDPASADNGRPLAPGTWDLQLQLGCGGWRTARTLRGYSIDVPDPEIARSGRTADHQATAGSTSRHPDPKRRKRPALQPSAR
ncbi:glycosyltransferase family 2 protein [Streptomyces marispadix]|uniref:Glycosyltransferase family 2 protein n=1 Tax=Streptomyces marispadix TaxID=2922868 RepID=A0ABS9SY97_9ACTN|nr:glycosyltransferase family A protein [Streptomyces marispadix]MCH6161183.1 glycosyltransferase family 2 protein [Streptomyces marispadix]